MQLCKTSLIAIAHMGVTRKFLQLTFPKFLKLFNKVLISAPAKKLIKLFGTLMKICLVLSLRGEWAEICKVSKRRSYTGRALVI